MNNLNNSKMKNIKLLKKILYEVFLGIFGLLGHIETRIGLAIFLLIPGIAIFLSNDIKSEENPWIFYLIASLLIISSFLLFISKIKDLKKNT